MFKLTVITLILKISLTYAETDTNYRLITPIKPLSYAITVKPYFDTNDDKRFTFDGEVTIVFKTDIETSQIRLHSENLTFSVKDVRVTSDYSYVFLSPVNPITFDTKYTFATLNLDGVLQVGQNYSLKIIYRGLIRSDLTGFYRAYYNENGLKKWLGATQMQATNARRVFPCFDEPALKATFTLTIDRPQSFQPSLANMKMQSSVDLMNGYIREKFFPTPIMSTYLLAFVISEFVPAQNAVQGSQEFNVYTRPEVANQTNFMFDFGERVVRALGQYFSIDYYSTHPNMKLHHVALPDFKSGAMENWGLATYRESSSLYVSGQSGPFYKYKSAEIVAHETTHMWFGDLVTCHWWSDLWLNEGFANYFQDFITNLIEPDLGSKDMAVIFTLYKAYDSDDDADSVPISNVKVNSPDEISTHFGAFSYQKAASVIRMIHHLVGDDAFKLGLYTYLELNKFSSGHPYLLYEALEKGVRLTGALSPYPEASVTDIMSSWISRAGYPIVDVVVDYEEETVTLNQNRFYIDSNENSEEIYKIPITYTTAMAPDFETTKPSFIFDSKSYKFGVEGIGKNDSWILFNIQETGIYRVNYDSITWRKIRNVLKTNRKVIHHLNRAKLLNDLFALYFSGNADFNLLHQTFEFLHDETHFAVISAAIRGFERLQEYYQGSDVLSVIEEYELHLLTSMINNLGYSGSVLESVPVQRCRQLVLETACKLGHHGSVQRALAAFKALKVNGTEITPSFRNAAYCTGLRFGSHDDFEFLWNRMLTHNVANEVFIILNALGCTTIEEDLKTYLRAVVKVDSPIRIQDVKVPISAILYNHSNVYVIMQEMKQNYDLWSSVYKSMDTVLSKIVKALHNEAEIDQFESWLDSCKNCLEDHVKSAKKTLISARKSVSWAAKHKDDILKTLTGNAFKTLPSITMLFILSFFVSLVL